MRGGARPGIRGGGQNGSNHQQLDIARAEITEMQELMTAADRNRNAAEHAVQDLNAQVQAVLASKQTAEHSMTCSLEASEAKMQRLEVELRAAKKGESDAAKRLAASRTEMATTLSASKQSREASQQAITRARQAETVLERQLQNSESGIEELRTKVQVLTEANARSRQELHVAQQVAADKEQRTIDFCAEAEQLRQRISELESAASILAEVNMQRKNSEVEDLRLSLAEAKSQAKSAVVRRELLAEEHMQLRASLREAQFQQQAAEHQLAEQYVSAEGIHRRAADAVAQVQRSIRIMVAAPKVSVNIGDCDRPIHEPFPFAAIQELVRRDVLPKFASACLVAEETGDVQLRKELQKKVEELALDLQSKVCELMPAAEGTCNWDGFGAKCDTLVSQKTNQQ